MLNQKLWSNQIESLKFEYRDTIEQHPDAEAVMAGVRGVLIAIARLAGHTPASVGETPKWTRIVQDMVETSRNLHRLLKEKQLCSALYCKHSCYTT
jgi:hypothetical protein